MEVFRSEEQESTDPTATASSDDGRKCNPLLEPVCLDGVVFDWKTESWMGRHKAICKAVQEGDPEVIFIGDSITHHWERDGIDSWAAHYSRFRPVNMGFGGDRVQHLLWRLQNGELENIAPKAAVLLIGTNNSADNTAEDIAEAIAGIVALLRNKLPQTRILLLAIFPRDTPDGPRRRVNAQVNGIIAGLDDGDWIHFRDLGGFLVDGSGIIKNELMEDLLHPTAAGYAAWADVLTPVLEELLTQP